MDWQQELLRLDGAYSENTLRSYRADFRIFEAWCRSNDLAALPAAPATIAAFLASALPTMATSTLRRRLVSIAKIHRLFKLPMPTEDEEVRIALRRAERCRHRRPAQALGLTAERRDRLIAACPGDLAGLRDRALISELCGNLGDEAIRRRSGTARS